MGKRGFWEKEIFGKGDLRKREFWEKGIWKENGNSRKFKSGNIGILGNGILGKCYIWIQFIICL